ncbi:MAG: hypothetical protein K2J64_09130 [Desulfovibrio sp.]|nr:hypothetical protein [Desulfovibrio sp.]
MQDVLFLEHMYPCHSYCLTRIGRRDLLTLEWLNNEFPKLLQPFKEGISLDIGNIIVWKNEAYNIYRPIHMKDNQIIFEQIKYNYHSSVYEGNGIVSDMVLDGEAIPLIIRKRRLEQLSRPDYFLRLDHK